MASRSHPWQREDLNATNIVVHCARDNGRYRASPGSRILNIADPDTPSVAEIARLITLHLGYHGRTVEVDNTGYPPVIGQTRWSIPRPFVLDCGAAVELGYTPATSYADAICATCDWLVSDATDADWTLRYPALASYTRNLFDYAAEDAFFSSGQRS